MNEGEEEEAFLLIFVLYKIGSGGLGGGGGEDGEWNDRLFEKIWWYRSFSVTWSAALQIAWNKGKF